MSTSTGHRGPFATDEKHFTVHSGTWSLSSPTLPLRDAQLTTDDMGCISLRAPRFHERVNCSFLEAGLSRKRHSATRTLPSNLSERRGVIIQRSPIALTTFPCELEEPRWSSAGKCCESPGEMCEPVERVCTTRRKRVSIPFGVAEGSSQCMCWHGESPRSVRRRCHGRPGTVRAGAILATLPFRPGRAHAGRPILESARDYWAPQQSRLEIP